MVGDGWWLLVVEFPNLLGLRQSIRGAATSVCCWEICRRFFTLQENCQENGTMAYLLVGCSVGWRVGVPRNLDNHQLFVSEKRGL